MYCLTILEVGKSKIKVSAVLVSSEASLFGLWMADFSLGLHMDFPLYLSNLFL